MEQQEVEIKCKETVIAFDKFKEGYIDTQSGYLSKKGNNLKRYSIEELYDLFKTNNND